MSIGKSIKSAAKELRDSINRPAFTMSPMYKAKRAKHEAARGVKAKMAGKMKKYSNEIEVPNDMAKEMMSKVARAAYLRKVN